MLTRQSRTGEPCPSLPCFKGQKALQDLIAQDLNPVQLVHSEHLLYTRPALGVCAASSHNYSGLSPVSSGWGLHIKTERQQVPYNSSPAPQHPSPSLGIWAPTAISGFTGESWSWSWWRPMETLKNMHTNCNRVYMLSRVLFRGIKKWWGTINIY